MFGDEQYTVRLTEDELRYLIAAIRLYKLEGSTWTYGQFGEQIEKNLIEQTSTTIVKAWTYYNQ